MRIWASGLSVYFCYPIWYYTRNSRSGPGFSVYGPRHELHRVADGILEGCAGLVRLPKMSYRGSQSSELNLESFMLLGRRFDFSAARSTKPHPYHSKAKARNPRLQTLDSRLKARNTTTWKSQAPLLCPSFVPEAPTNACPSNWKAGTPWPQTLTASSW